MKYSYYKYKFYNLLINASLGIIPLTSICAEELPRFLSHNCAFSEECLQKATDLFKILQPYQLLYDIDKASIAADCQNVSTQSTNSKYIIQELAQHYQQNALLNIVLIGFPPKSTNIEKKVLGKLPDMAEYYGLLHLNNLLEEMRKAYPFGVTLTIISDGVVFNDIIGISDEDLKAYENALKKLSSQFKGIQIISSDDLEKKGFSSLEKLRNSIDQIELEDKNSQNKEALNLMHQRMILEFNHKNGQEFLKHHTIADISNRMLERSKKFGKFLKLYSIIPKDAFHFSVHFQTGTSHKFGVKLSPSSCITPWHGVMILENDGSWRILHHQNVDHTRYYRATFVINGVSCNYYKPYH